MRRLAPALILSSLLVNPSYGTDWIISGSETKNLNNETINSIMLEGNGYLMLNSSGTSTINKMQMFWLEAGAGATFNVNGTLNLDLSIANMDHVQNQIVFNIQQGAKLNITSGINFGGKGGVFQGDNTILSVALAKDSTFNGNLLNSGKSIIQITNGATLNGNLSQTQGELDATIEGKLDGGILISREVTQTNLWANKDDLNIATQSATITGNITQGGGRLNGVMKGLTLEGSFTQSGGISDIDFHQSVFNGAVTLNQTRSSLIHFYESTIKSVSITGGQNNTINLGGKQSGGGNGSHMDGYNGTDSITFIKLKEHSSMQNATQTRGELNIGAITSQIKGSITGEHTNLIVALTDSEIQGSISNSGPLFASMEGVSNIDTKNARIGGNIIQNGGQIRADLHGTRLEGNFTQMGGNLARLKAINSTIMQGIFLTNTEARFSDEQIALGNTMVHNGIRIKNLREETKGSISDNSSITGGFFQEGRERLQLTFSASSLEGGISVYDSNNTVNNPTNPNHYMTTFFFKDRSSYNGAVISSNHSLWLELQNNSRGMGNITITRGNAYIKGMMGSTITGNLISNDTRETRLYFVSSTFDGNITQTNGKQHISILGTRLLGSITNSASDSVFAIDRESQMNGSYTQDNGSLLYLAGGNSRIGGSFTLNDVATKVGNGTAEIHAESIGGNWTQNRGSLTGAIGGLTLEGFFVQNGGVANVRFNSANFHNPTSINGAVSSKVIFDWGSQIKDYTINESGRDAQGNIVNSLKLDHVTILTGNFTLNNSSSKLSVINESQITGNIIIDENSEIEIETKNGGNIGGDINIKGGNAGGDFEGGNIGGNIILENANSHFHFKDSTIGGKIDINRGHTIMTLDHTEIVKGFKMQGRGEQDPSLVFTISNGSNIGENVEFIATDVFFGGSGRENIIKGSLISTDSNLSNTQPVFIENKHPGKEPVFPLSLSGLTIQRGLQQTRGTLDLVMQGSNIQGQTKIENPTKFHLLLTNQSSLGDFQIIGGEDNLLTLQNQTIQNGATNLVDTKIVTKVLDRSSILGDITASSRNSDTKIYLDNQSRLASNINQNNGVLLLDFNRFSSFQGVGTFSNLEGKIALNQDSVWMGPLTLNSSTFDISLNNRSRMQSSITSTASTLNIEAKNASSLAGEITYTGNDQRDFGLKLSFKSNSVLENTTMIINGNAQIKAFDSTINSTEIDLISGKLDLTLSASRGTIQSLKTGGANSINILTTNFSNSEISNLKISDNALLTLVAKGSATIRGHLEAEERSKISFASLENARIRFDITPRDETNLEIALNGGVLQGRVIQDNPSLGKIVLGGSGNFGGRWIMSDDSSIREMGINNSATTVGDHEGVMKLDSANTPVSMVDMTKDIIGESRIGRALIPSNQIPTENQTRAKTLTLLDLKGSNGVFRVYADIGATLADKLTTNTALGSHVVQVYYNPATFSENLDGKHIVVAHVNDISTTADFRGGYTDVGTQSYKTELKKVSALDGRGWDWILGKAQNTGPSYGTKIIASILQSQYRTFAIQTETLNQRLGELRDLNRIDGIWARYSMGENSTKESKEHLQVEDNYYSAWFGYDQNSLSLKGQNFLGFALSYTLVAPDSKDYTGEIHNIGFNFYDVFVAQNDFYVDLVAKYILSYGLYDINYYSLATNIPKYFNHKFMLSAEIGKKFKIGQGRKNYFYLQPEAQITSGYILGNEMNFVDASNTTINATLGHNFPVIMRAGLTGAYAMEYSSFKGDIRLGTSLVYETGNGGSVELDDGNSKVDYKYKGAFHLLLQAGANFILNESSRVYLEASTGFFGDTSTTYAINAGVRFNFGPKNTRRLKVPSLTPPPPPPSPEYDPRNIPTITDNTKIDIRNNGIKKAPYGDDYFINTRKNFRDSTSIKR